MRRFGSIDNKLTDFAKKFNTQLSDGREFHRKDVEVYEERRVHWTEGEINRMILIRPYPFDETSGEHSSTWDFINVAWLNNSPSSPVPMWEKYLVYNGDFKLITAHIDDLLKKSEEILNNVKLKDLKKSIKRRSKLKPGLQ